MTDRARPRKRKRFNGQIFLMAMMGVAFLFVFAYLPMFGIAIGFKNMDYSMNIMKDLQRKPWVGLENFRKFIQDAQFTTVMTNTLMLSVTTLALGMPIATNSTIFCYQFGANEEVASSGVFVSTLLSVVSIPLLLTLLFAA